jgi:predicted permease
MLFSAVLATLTGVIFGLVPAVRATRPDLVGALKEGNGAFCRSRLFGLRNILVVAQVGICMVLLVCSGLFLRSLGTAANIDIGMAHRNLLLVGFDPSQNHYSSAETSRILDTILSRSGAIPGVESVTLTSSVPLNMEGTQNVFTPQGSTSEPIQADIYSVAPRFFSTFGIRFLAGEDFRPGLPQADIAIVNQALADRAFPQQNPVGRYIRYFNRTVLISGLVATSKSRSIGEDPRPCLYFPMARDLKGNDSFTGMSLVMRTHGKPSSYANAVQQTFREIDPALAAFEIRTMDAHLSQALFLPRVAAYLFGLPGLMGLLISTIGIYGLISFTVARQTHEIGVRMALGARRGQVLAMVLKRALALTLTGSAIGLAVAIALSQAAASLLYGISPRDPLTLATVPVLLVLIAMVAGWLPARRAAALDPLRALRYE